MASFIQNILLTPSEWIISLILSLFGINFSLLPDHWKNLMVGIVALLILLHSAKLIIGVIQRRVFGHYGNGG